MNHFVCVVEKPESRFIIIASYDEHKRKFCSIIPLVLSSCLLLMPLLLLGLSCFLWFSTKRSQFGVDHYPRMKDIFICMK